MRRFDFDQGLAPYDLTSYSQWRSLSHHISKKVRGHLLCACILRMLPSDVVAFSLPIVASLNLCTRESGKVVALLFSRYHICRFLSGSHRRIVMATSV